MSEPLLLLAALIVAGAVVTAPLWRPLSDNPTVDDERDAAALRHRVALEALRDVELDRRAGSLDDATYAQQLADAEARAAATSVAVERDPGAPRSISRAPNSRALAAGAAGLIGLALVVGSVLPATGIANETRMNDGLVAAQDAESERQGRIVGLLADLDADPSDARALSDLADAYLAGSSEDDLVRAAVALRLLVDLEPDRADAYERIIAAYLRAGDYGNARAALDSYAAIAAPDEVELAFFEGLIALRGEEDADAARTAFERFLQLAPDDPRAGMVRGLREEASAP